MDSTMIDERFENLDRRVEHVEQILRQDVIPRLEHVEEILPRLASKDDLKMFATKADLDAVARRDEMRAQFDRLRLDMRILFEHQDSKLQLIAEHVLSLLPKPKTE